MNTPYTSENSRTPIADRVRKTSGIDFSGIKKGSAVILILLSVLLNQQTTYSQTYSAYQAGNQTTYGTNEWIGYVYANTDFTTGYMGYYTATPNFSIDWGSGGPGPFGSTYMSDNEHFRVRYKMTKTFETGLYSFAIQADDAAAVSTNGGTSWNVLNDWDCSGTVNTTVNSVQLSGTHNLIFEYGECTAGASAGITITQTCQMPGPPQNPTGVGTGLTTATLSWGVGSPAGTSTYYSYYVYRVSDNVMVIDGFRGTQNTSVNITGLTANTQYYFKVKSEPSCWANWTELVTSNNFYTGIIPGTPTSLTTTAIGTTTATLNWAAGSPVGNPAPTYYWVLKNAGGTTFTSGNTTGFTVSVGGLTTNTSYYFTVYASNNVGTSAIATSANMITLPVTPSAVTATPSSIALGASSDLNATSAGNTIDWYTASGAGTLLGSTASGANFVVAPATTSSYYAEAVAPPTNSGQQLFLAANWTSSFVNGLMFDVTALSAARSVTAFAYNIASPGGVKTIKVYYKSGTYSGNETNASSWTYLGDFVSDGLYYFSTIDIPDITIPAGSTYGFYLYSTDGILKAWNNSNSSSYIFSNSSLSVSCGSSTGSLFGSVNTNKSLNGLILYGDRGAVSATRTSVGLTVIQSPTTQASNVTFSSVGSGQFTTTWSNGNGSSRAVFIKAASSGNAAPVNGTTYTASTTFGSGTQIGSTGWYCVYNGTGTPVTVTGLSASTAYQVHVCEYNGTTGNQAYNVSTATNNPKTQTTTTPNITTSGTLSAFSSCYGIASSYQSFTASGSNLLANITVTAPTGFEVSLTSGGVYTSSVTLTQSGGTVSNTSVYVRLSNSASGSPSGNISLTSTGATTRNVAASGTVSQPPSASNAGPDQTSASTCGLTTVTLAANTPSIGTGAWSITSGTGGSVTSPSSPTSTFTGTAGSTYTLRWTISSGPCTASFDDVIITFNRNPTTAAAGPDQNGSSTCGLTQVTLAANSPSVGTGAWSVVTGTGGSFGNSSSASSTFSGVAGNTYTLRWTISNSPCTASSDDVIVTFNIAPTTANAGVDQTGSSTCGLTTVTMAATALTVGTGAWSIISGTGGSFANINSISSTFTGTAGNAYTLQWTTTNGVCTSSDQMLVTFNRNPSASNAGPDQTSASTCGLTQVTLAANTPSVGAGAWSIISGSGGTVTTPSSPTSTFTGTAGSTYTLRWTISNNPCTASADEVNITFNRAPTVSNAGADQTGNSTCGQSFVVLAANTPTVGTGSWSITSGTGGQLLNASNPTTNFAGTPGNSYTLLWTISNSPCTASTDEVIITFNRNPTTANAGADQTGSSTCGLTTVTMAATTLTVGTGSWSIVSGTGGSFGNINSISSTFTGTAGSAYTLRWTTTNGVCTSIDDMFVTFNRNPTTATAGVDLNNCNSGTFTLAGNNPSVGTGAWSVVTGTAAITTASAYNSGVTGIPAGTSATLRWTISNSPCTASTDNVVLTNYELPVVASITGTNTLAVGTTSTLSCVTAGGSWSSSATAVATVNAGVVTGVTAGTATISYTVTDGNGCSNASTKLVTVGKGDQTISFTLASPQNYGVSPITLNGTATSGLTVSYASSNTNVATISGNTLSIVGIGSATITASQAGNANYNAAENVTQSLTVNAAGLTWTGNTNTDWNTAGNWSPATVPTADYDVTIPSGTTYTPHITSAVTSPARCNSLTLASGSLLTIDAGKALTVNGTFTNSGTAAALVIESGGSLIETTSGVKATVKRAMVAGEWHLISSPVSNATAGMFDGYYLQKHTESSNAYTDITTSGEVLTPMRGYALWGDALLPSATFAGPLNIGDKSFSTTAGTYTTGPPVNGGWNLVGNPYPSSIDWQATSGWTKTGINNAIYIHISSSSWAAFVNGVGTPLNMATRYIAPCQGFFVQATAAGELAMTDAVRVHNTTEYFKNSEIVPNLIRLEVSGNGYKDEAVVRFVDEATAEFDGNYDAHKLFGEVAAAAQVYTTGTGQLSINSLPETNMVPVGVKIGTTGTYTITATEINDMPFASLEDTKTGIFTQLAKSSYTFQFEAGENEMRFKLHFSALGTGETEAVNANIYSYQKKVFVSLKDQAKGDIYIYNLTGQLLVSRLSASGMNEFTLPVTGAYIVRVITESRTDVEKVIIN